MSQGNEVGSSSAAENSDTRADRTGDQRGNGHAPENLGDEKKQVDPRLESKPRTARSVAQKLLVPSFKQCDENAADKKAHKPRVVISHLIKSVLRENVTSALSVFGVVESVNHVRDSVQKPTNMFVVTFGGDKAMEHADRAAKVGNVTIEGEQAVIDLDPFGKIAEKLRRGYMERQEERKKQKQHQQQQKQPPTGPRSDRTQQEYHYQTQPVERHGRHNSHIQSTERLGHHTSHSDARTHYGISSDWDKPLGREGGITLELAHQRGIGMNGRTATNIGSSPFLFLPTQDLPVHETKTGELRALLGRGMSGMPRYMPTDIVRDTRNGWYVKFDSDRTARNCMADYQGLRFGRYKLRFIISNLREDRRRLENTFPSSSFGHSEAPANGRGMRRSYSGSHSYQPRDRTKSPQRRGRNSSTVSRSRSPTRSSQREEYQNLRERDLDNKDRRRTFVGHDKYRRRHESEEKDIRSDYRQYNSQKGSYEDHSSYKSRGYGHRHGSDQLVKNGHGYLGGDSHASNEEGRTAASPDVSAGISGESIYEQPRDAIMKDTVATLQKEANDSFIKDEDADKEQEARLKEQEIKQESEKKKVSKLKKPLTLVPDDESDSFSTRINTPNDTPTVETPVTGSPPKIAKDLSGDVTEKVSERQASNGERRKSVKRVVRDYSSSEDEDDEPGVENREPPKNLPSVESKVTSKTAPKAEKQPPKKAPKVEAKNPKLPAKKTAASKNVHPKKKQRAAEPEPEPEPAHAVTPKAEGQDKAAKPKSEVGEQTRNEKHDSVDTPREISWALKAGDCSRPVVEDPEAPFAIADLLDMVKNETDLQYLKAAVQNEKGATIPNIEAFAYRARHLPQADPPQPKAMFTSFKSRGYRKIPDVEKDGYLVHRRENKSRPVLARDEDDVPGTPTEQLTAKTKTSSRGNRVTARREEKAFNDSEAFRMNKLKKRKKPVEFRRSAIHDWGLYALEPIPKGEMIIEYVGEVIRSSLQDTRERQYQRSGIGSSYLFHVDNTQVIDATKRGGIARFINHSCEPSCIARIIRVDGTDRIGIYAARDIGPGEELTYDYKFEREEGEDRVPCLCGSAKCKGWLN